MDISTQNTYVHTHTYTHTYALDISESVPLVGLSLISGLYEEHNKEIQFPQPTARQVLQDLHPYNYAMFTFSYKLTNSNTVTAFFQCSGIFLKVGMMQG
jgi:hypothetical protein